MLSITLFYIQFERVSLYEKMLQTYTNRSRIYYQKVWHSLRVQDPANLYNLPVCGLAVTVSHP